ncbi:MAG: DUF4058 family protein [Pirellulaceae bacterium]|nr:DUF4058 family protein [Pirellulaceae bacterium]
MNPQTSPFPGMDPYLEARWSEVHARLIVYASNQLNLQLPEDLRTGIEQTLGVWAGETYCDTIRPDVLVVKESAVAEPYATQAVAVAAPVIVPRLDPRERHLEIVDPAGRVITVIEFLSPWNKIGRHGREQYSERQKRYLNSSVNLVEIDLVRQGAYMLAAPESLLPETMHSVYMICVYRNARPERFEVYPAPLRERLPNIPIPLRLGETDAVLQLQPLIDDCYRDGRCYGIDYQKDPVPRLASDDAQWLDALLREQGRRT